jgi:hypothetical protein
MLISLVLPAALIAPMDTDFLDAAHRHLMDARLLDRKHGRYANADHLYGIAAECMLKAIMVGLGATLSTKGNLQERAHRQHIDTLWGEYCAFAAGRGGISYLPFPSHHCLFAGWRIDQRYAPERHFTAGHLQAKRRQEETAECGRALQRAILDGIL